MTNSQPNSRNELVEVLWVALFRGMKLRHVSEDDQRVYLLQWIDWATHSTEVTDARTGETFIFPWDELEFVEPIESNIPGFPPASKKSKKRRKGSK